MPKELSSYILGELNAQQKRPVLLFELQLSTTIRFVAGKDSVTFNSFNYGAKTIEVTKVEQLLEGQIGRITVKFDNILKDMSGYMYNEDFKGKKLIIKRVYLDANGNAGSTYNEFFNGYIEKFEDVSNRWLIIKATKSGPLSKKVLNIKYQRMCPWVFGGAECNTNGNADLTVLKKSGTATGGTNGTLIDTSFTAVSDYYNNGLISITKDSRIYNRLVKDYTLSSKTIEFDVSLPVTVDTSCTYTVYKGCDQKYNTCEGGAVDMWNQKDSSPSKRYGSVSAEANGKIYMGLGYGSSVYYRDWYEYDPSTDTWATKTNFPGTARGWAVAVSCNNKIYVGTGYSPLVFHKDWWEYDPSGNSWIQKTNFIGNGIYGSSAFCVGNYIYFGIGDDSTGYKKNWYRYYPAGNSWVTRLTFPGTARAEAAGGVANSKIYLGTGRTINTGYGGPQDDWYEYDPSTNTWATKTNFIGGARWGSMGAGANDKIYIGCGKVNYDHQRDWYQYDPIANAWYQQENFLGDERTSATIAVANDKMYAGFGYKSGTEFLDWYEYGSDPILWGPSSNNTINFGGCIHINKETVNE